MLFITCTKTNDINTEPVPQRCSSKKVFCKSSANLQYSTMQKCWAKFFEITFPYGSPPVHLLHTCRAHFWIEAMGATFENNSFAQVNSKYCLQKLKWRNLTLQKFCYLFVGLKFTKILPVHCNSWSGKYATESCNKIK